MCECYQIGGPWIAEDPNCPVHGFEARQRETELNERIAATAFDPKKLRISLNRNWKSGKSCLIVNLHYDDDVVSTDHIQLSELSDE